MARVATKKPFLSEDNIEKRLKWAQTYEHYGEKDFARIIYSDECKITATHNGIHYVRRYKGEDPLENEQFII